ncbi:hypothetical protein [Methylobacterium sp.]|uniref:hypothetical protein n=1 Tax=Methylobacterium sp. TaxID=409 RepID=UPI003AFFA761
MSQATKSSAIYDTAAPGFCRADWCWQINPGPPLCSWTNRGCKSGRLRVAAGASRLAIEHGRALRDGRQTFGLATTSAGRRQRASPAETRAPGFQINLVFVGIARLLQSRTRVAERVKRGGHPVRPADLERRWARNSEHLLDARRVAHRVSVFDT